MLKKMYIAHFDNIQTGYHFVIQSMCVVLHLLRYRYHGYTEFSHIGETTKTNGKIVSNQISHKHNYYRINDTSLCITNKDLFLYITCFASVNNNYITSKYFKNIYRMTYVVGDGFPVQVTHLLHCLF